MDYDEMANGIDRATNQTALLAENLAPVLAEILQLETPYELSFSEMSLVKLPTDYRVRKYQLKVNVSLLR